MLVWEALGLGWLEEGWEDLRIRNEQDFCSLLHWAAEALGHRACVQPFPSSRGQGEVQAGDGLTDRNGAEGSSVGAALILRSCESPK